MAVKVSTLDRYQNRVNKRVGSSSLSVMGQPSLGMTNKSSFTSLAPVNNPNAAIGAGAVNNNPQAPLSGMKSLITPNQPDFTTHSVPVGDKSIYSGKYNELNAIEGMGESALNKSTADVNLENKRRNASNSMLSSQFSGGEGEFDFSSAGLDSEQQKYASQIMSIGKQRGLDDNDITIAIMTALAESGLKNLNYGDRDSVGLFQQRTSQGWGTIDQILDSSYSINKFYDAYMPNRGGHANPWQVAQNVQRSAFADGSNYKAQYAKAQAIVAAARNGGGGSAANVNAASSFINSHNNKYLDFDGAYGAQCVDLFNYYNQSFVGGGFIGGVSGAKDIWSNRQMDQNYNRMSASARPNMGDVVVWDGSMGSGYGHVAIVVGYNADGTIRVLQSNATSAGSRGNSVISNMSRSGVLGYFRPKKLA